MQVKGKIIRITVTEEDIFSLRVRIDDECASDIIDEFRKLKSISQKYTLVDVNSTGNRLFFTGKIKSLNIVKGLTVVMHTVVIVPLVLKSLELKGKTVYVRFFTAEERELMDLLDAAARIESVDKAELLYRLTTFKSKSGDLRTGKRSIYDLSQSQRKVVLDKLHKSLSLPSSPT